MLLSCFSPPALVVVQIDLLLQHLSVCSVEEREGGSLVEVRIFFFFKIVLALTLTSLLPPRNMLKKELFPLLCFVDLRS